MNVAKTRSKGVSGMQGIPDPGGETEQMTTSSGPIRQSGPADSNDLSTKVRIRLSRTQARQWMTLPPKLRQHVTRVVFGAALHGVDLRQLASAESELRSASLAITNLLQLALVKGAALDTRRAHAALDRIHQLLGGKRP